MRWATVRKEGAELAAIATGRGLVLIETVNAAENKRWGSHLDDIFAQGQWEEIVRWYQEGGKARLEQLSAIPAHEAEYAPLYRHPRKIWGIGMNYANNAAELADIPPDSEPVGFMKPDTSIIGPRDAICIPPQSQVTTAEAELGIIIGKACRNIPESDAPYVVAGFTTVLDMTAADIHGKNPRFLTRAKSFDTFFSFGPHLITGDEIPNVSDLAVATGLNGRIVHRNVVSNMRYHPWYVVSFHSHVMTLLPGDIIMTGTPGPVVIREGDVAECHIDGFEPLTNPVRRCSGFVY